MLPWRAGGNSPLQQGLRTCVERLSHISYSTSSLRILSTSSTCDKDVSIPASARQRLGQSVRWLASPQEEADLQWSELLLVYKEYSCSPLQFGSSSAYWTSPRTTHYRLWIEASACHSLAAGLRNAFILYSGTYALHSFKSSTARVPHSFRDLIARESEPEPETQHGVLHWISRLFKSIAQSSSTSTGVTCYEDAYYTFVDSLPLHFASNTWTLLMLPRP